MSKGSHPPPAQTHTHLSPQTPSPPKPPSIILRKFAGPSAQRRVRSLLLLFFFLITTPRGYLYPLLSPTREALAAEGRSPFDPLSISNRLLTFCRRAWTVLGASLAVLASACWPLGASRGRLGFLFGRLRRLLGRLGLSLGRLWPSCAVLGSSWGRQMHHLYGNWFCKRTPTNPGVRETGK